MAAAVAPALGGEGEGGEAVATGPPGRINQALLLAELLVLLEPGERFFAEKGSSSSSDESPGFASCRACCSCTAMLGGGVGCEEG